MIEYPIMITADEIGEYTSYHIDGLTNENEVNDLLATAHEYVYRLIYGTGKRSVRNRIIEKYREQVERPVKYALCKMAAYLLENGDAGNFNGVRESTDGTSASITPKEQITKNAIPDSVIVMLAITEPRLIYFGEYLQ